jgi:hypothetical protein
LPIACLELVLGLETLLRLNIWSIEALDCSKKLGAYVLPPSGLYY